MNSKDDFIESESISEITFYDFLNRLHINNLLILEEEEIESTLNKILLADELEEDYKNILDETLKYYGYRIREDHRLEGNIFKSHLEQYYGYSFFFLDLIYLLSIELGKVVLENIGEKSKLEEVVLLHHVRGCLIFDEIKHLVKGGYGTGAIARLRSLHESAVIVEFIMKHGEGVAKAYLDYIPVMQAKDTIFLEGLYGENDDTSKALESYRKVVPLLEKEYGKDFVDLRSNNDYIWAKNYLTKQTGTRFGFNALRNDVNRNYGKEQYKLASNNIHSAPKSVISSLNTVDGLPNAGASNIGISEPSQWAIYELLQLNVMIMNIFIRKEETDFFKRLQVIFTVRLIQSIINETYESFSEAEKKLRAEIGD
ncbi:hypothetical protein COE86_04235 [Bacillus toyonensis]|uniref:DUF5677 domain-containing protein n=1 Tax=Bacillus toyonensis TaxID=155322 RepID=UPI000BFBB352|nr:DUF5677 domain-containing protein [Bacillus toyonensis]PHB39089.1 hypothetical protein COE86_04235 [Bacillus toyonensis]